MDTVSNENTIELPSSDVLRQNYIYNTLLTVLFQLFNVFTLPWVARIFGPELLGTVQYGFTIAMYFLLPLIQGIPFFTIREISKVRDDPVEMNKVFSELFFLNFLFVTGAMMIYGVLLLMVDKLRSELLLYLVIGLVLVTNFLNIRWLFQALEKYKEITIGTLVVVAVSVALVYAFVNQPEHYILFSVFWVLATGGVNFVYFLFGSRHVKIRMSVSWEAVKRLKGMGIIVFTFVVIDLYVYFDTILLGAFVGDYYVGLYAPVMRILDVMLIVLLSLNVVILPRLSYYVKKGMKEAYGNLARFSLQYVYILAPALVLFFFILAPSLIEVLAGPGYEGSVLALQVIIPILLVIGLGSFFGFQILMSQDDEEDKLFITAVCGLVTSVVLNLLLIPEYRHIGAAYVRLVTELVILSGHFIFAYKYLNFRAVPSWQNIIGLGLLTIALVVVRTFVAEPILTIVLGILLGLVVYVGSLLVLKEELVTHLVRSLKEKYLQKG